MRCLIESSRASNTHKRDRPTDNSTTTNNNTVECAKWAGRRAIGKHIALLSARARVCIALAPILLNRMSRINRINQRPLKPTAVDNAPLRYVLQVARAGKIANKKPISHGQDGAGGSLCLFIGGARPTHFIVLHIAPFIPVTKDAPTLCQTCIKHKHVFMYTHSSASAKRAPFAPDPAGSRCH